MALRTVDLNADMGEGFGAYRIGDDAALLDIVTSANVACGFHGGDPEIMHETMRMAYTRKVTIGAHPGFPDLWGFGRRVIPFTCGEIERLVAYQIGAAQAIAAYAGCHVSYVKIHGALANLAEHDEGVASAIITAIKAVDASLSVVAIAYSALERLAREQGLRVHTEIFADRAYAEDGHLLSRKEDGAVLHDPALIAERVVRMVEARAIETVKGNMLETQIDTICVHGDSAHALDIARTVRRSLEGAGIMLKSPHESTYYVV